MPSREIKKQRQRWIERKREERKREREGKRRASERETKRKTSRERASEQEIYLKPYVEHAPTSNKSKRLSSTASDSPVGAASSKKER